MSSGTSSKNLPRVGIPVNANVAFSLAKVQCQSTVDDHNLEKIEERNIVIQHFAKWMYQARVSFNAVKLRSFAQALEVVGRYGVGLRPSTYHESWIKWWKKLEKNMNKTGDRYEIIDDDETQPPDPESCKEFDDDETQLPDPELCKEAEAEFDELNHDGDIEEDFSYVETGAELVFSTAGDGLAGAQLLDEDLNFISLDGLVYDCF
ncbi:hypothetical protein RJ639_012074 [Escallonia herrerae]|uniref:Uncharacterized protein n=1 Tax=Escallonia herrerae TaxID=1293975 RepID=A0AA88VMC1_9ASTE|nr:hypothetical protein RJ639_012074 [Escallonia herrerae]